MRISSLIVFAAFGAVVCRADEFVITPIAESMYPRAANARGDVTGGISSAKWETACSYRQDFGPWFFEGGSAALDINDDRIIVGWGRRGQTTARRAFVYDAEWSLMTELGTFGGWESEAYAINNAGVVVGTAMAIEDGHHGFIYRIATGLMEPVYVGTDPTAAITSINERGDIAGTFYPNGGGTRRFAIINSIVVEFGDGVPLLNNEGQVLLSGTDRFYDGQQLLGLPMLPGAVSVTAFGLNDHGDIVGTTRIGSAWHVTIWENLIPRDLHRAQFGASSQGRIITNEGRIYVTTETGWYMMSKRGDANWDGRIDNFDIDAFVLAINDPDAYERDIYCDPVLHCDINGDGLFNNFDIDLFVECVALQRCP